MPTRHAPAAARSRPVVLTRKNVSPHAGGKAPADVQRIGARMGFGSLTLPPIPEKRFSVANFDRLVRGTLTLVARVLFRGAPETLIIQHPVVGQFEKRLILALFKRSKKIALIHDLDVLRRPSNHMFDDLIFLGQCDVLIAHNENMRRFLAAELPHTSVLVLGIFDYLAGSVPRDPPAPAPRPARLFVIGNLNPQKASYIYSIDKLQTPLVLYGPNCAVERLPKDVTWHGVVGEAGLPIERIDGFGLVWDGRSPDALEGEWGEYLRFNAPHKLSLYMVLGLPVIVHRQSAMADFVRSEGIGFDTDSIAEASARVSRCSAEEWQAYCANVLRVRQKIMSGFYTTQVFERAVETLHAAPAGPAIDRAAA